MRVDEKIYEVICKVFAHPNRKNARKESNGSGCRMCKPWKHKWEHKFKRKERGGE